jgi:hypothetical protein
VGNYLGSVAQFMPHLAGSRDDDDVRTPETTLKIEKPYFLFWTVRSMFRI